MGKAKDDHDRVVALVKKAPGTEIGVLVWTPAMVKAEFVRVDGEIAALNKDIYAWWSAFTHTVPPSEAEATADRFKENWRIFVDDWKKYYDDASRFPGTGWGGHVDRVQRYEGDVKRWREEFQKLGGKTTGPPPRDPEVDSGFPWKTALIVIGTAIGGIFALPRIIAAYRKSKGAE